MESVEIQIQVVDDKRLTSESGEKRSRTAVK